jgi:hypothetical protein
MKQMKDFVENLENSDSFKKWPHAPNAERRTKGFAREIYQE